MVLFEYLSFFLLIFTSLVGIFSIVRAIADWVYGDSSELKPVSILRISGEDDRIEMLIRGFFSKTDGEIIIVDTGCNEEMLKKINIIKGNRENVWLLKKDELQSKLDEILY